MAAQSYFLQGRWDVRPDGEPDGGWAGVMPLDDSQAPPTCLECQEGLSDASWSFLQDFLKAHTVMPQLFMGNHKLASSLASLC